MKTVTIPESSREIRALLDQARDEDVIVRLSDGSEFMLSAIDDFDHEIARTRRNEKLMALLDIRAGQTRTIPLEEVKRQLGLGSERRFDVASSTNVPDPEAFKEGLLRIWEKMTENQKVMLQKLYHAPERTMTAHEMARAVGFGTNYGAANDQFGKLGTLLAAEMGYQPEDDDIDRQSSVLALRRSDSTGVRWTMRPALARALEELRQVDPPDTL